MIEKIHTLFPEFKASSAYDAKTEDLPSVFVGDFAGFAIEELHKGNQILVDRIVNFVNDVYRDGDEESKNLIWVGFFEIVGSDGAWIELLNRDLDEPIRSEFASRF